MDPADHAGRQLFRGKSKMSDDKRKFFSADSLERAVLLAASHFGIDPDRVAYQRVEKKGMIRSGRKFLIEVDSARPEREAAAVRTVAASPVVVRPASVAGTGTPTGREERRMPAPGRGRDDRRRPDDRREPLAPGRAAPLSLRHCPSNYRTGLQRGRRGAGRLPWLRAECH